MSRPLYVTLSQVLAKVPREVVTGALDDNGDGEIDPLVWEEVASTACGEVDSALGQRYTTPFVPNPGFPAIVVQAALLFVCESLYLRRGLGESKTNPWLDPADRMRQKLDDMGAGKIPLNPTITRPVPSVSAITQRSRANPIYGNLNT